MKHSAAIHIGVRAMGWRGELQPPYSGKTIIFRAKAKLFGQPKMKKKYFFCIY